MKVTHLFNFSLMSLVFFFQAWKTPLISSWNEWRGGRRTGVGGSVAEVLLGEQQQGLAVHLERAAGDRPQGEFLLCPSQPLGHILPAPKDRLQTCRWKYLGKRERKRMNEWQLKPGLGKAATKWRWRGTGRNKRRMNSARWQKDGGGGEEGRKEERQEGG